jgi:acetyl-CoA carboxylase beta subunit
MKKEWLTLAKEHVCEKCGKTWKVIYPPELAVKVQACQECCSFKFHLSTASDGRPIGSVKNAS